MVSPESEAFVFVKDALDLRSSKVAKATWLERVFQQ